VDVMLQDGATSDFTVSGGVSADVKVPRGALSDCTGAGGYSADMKYKVGLCPTVQCLGELVRM
jgi:hypothetical protein